ncbi:hypothetical protein PAUR_a1732 [Pseudoalteromonas aurantia 208]|uniref:Uncharacterized protein n=1 Tax=Pseudoalteromonas aurantia 208 TaxID=1314867 RepID=A0ABR9EB30_9GAMM|nr:hypothetical protein [Pseudoalteromonas aurantia 208]
MNTVTERDYFLQKAPFVKAWTRPCFHSPIQSISRPITTIIDSATYN